MRRSVQFTGSVLTSNLRRLSFPFKCSFAVTYHCNLRCVMCNIWKKPSREEVTPRQAQRFFRTARDFSWIGITGGEAFLREDLDELILPALFYSRRLNALHFATNGSLPARIRRTTAGIQKRYPDIRLVFTVSIDGPAPLHDRIRGVNDAWERAIESFRYLKGLRNVKTQIGFTLGTSNLHAFRDTFTGLKRVYPALRFDDININIFQQSTFYYDNLHMRSPNRHSLLKEVERILLLDNDGLTLNNMLRRIYLRLYGEYVRRNRPPVTCRALSSTLFIDPSGDIYPCAVYKRKVAHISETGPDLGKIWKSEHARAVSRECRLNQCPSCWSPCDAYSAISGSLIKSLFTYARSSLPTYR